MSRQTGPSPEVRAEVLGRNGGMCLRCNLNRAEQVHHRKPRGMGGTRDDKINSPANLVGICAPCHRHVESFRGAAMAAGWLVARYRDPAETVLIDTANRTLVLSDDGTWVRDEPFTHLYPDGDAA